MKRVVSIQDISCIGKCSQTIALPILSAMGIETAVIPTAVLSTHTMFPNFTFKDLTDQIKPIIQHWKEQNIHFDAILSGYLGTIEQINLLSLFYDEFASPDTIKVLDPAFADNGKMYTGFDMEYANAMKELCHKADYIIPNITEAAFLADVSYQPNYDASYIKKIIDRLVDMGAKNIIITSVINADKNGVIFRSDGESDSVNIFNKHVEGIFHGTGDMFASVFTGSLLRGFSTKKAIDIAIAYTTKTLETTVNNKKHHWYGVDFETTIPYLLKLADIL